jgi:alpha-galactosidase
MRSKDEWAKLDSLTASFDLFKNLGYLPAISDRHLSEFFPFFLSSSEYLRRWNIKRTRISDRTAWAENARKNLNAILSGEKELTLSKSRDIVVDIINALAGAGETTTTINYPNGGQIENLPRGAVVETVARFNSRGITPLPVGALPAPLMPIVLPHILRQRVALQAALEGSRELFAAALLTDPTVRDLASVPDMARELIAAQKDLLPQFSRV